MGEYMCVCVCVCVRACALMGAYGKYDIRI